MASGVYEILNTANGKRYIGSAKSFARRWTAHHNHLLRGTHHSRHLQSAWNKYGEAAFKFLPILTCQPSMLLFYEQQLLDKVKPEYNILPTAGSQLGAKRAPGFQVGRVQSLETRLKIAAGRLGVQSPAVAEANRARVFTPEMRANLGAVRKGKPQSPEHVAKRAAARIGKPLSAEHRAKIAKAREGKTASEETRAKMSAAQNKRFAKLKTV